MSAGVYFFMGVNWVITVLPPTPKTLSPCSLPSFKALTQDTIPQKSEYIWRYQQILWGGTCIPFRGSTDAPGFDPAMLTSLPLPLPHLCHVVRPDTSSALSLWATRKYGEGTCIPPRGSSNTPGCFGSLCPWSPVPSFLHSSCAWARHHTHGSTVN